MKTKQKSQQNTQDNGQRESMQYAQLTGVCREAERAYRVVRTCLHMGSGVNSMLGLC